MTGRRTREVFIDVRLRHLRSDHPRGEPRPVRVRHARPDARSSRARSTTCSCGSSPCSSPTVRSQLGQDRAGRRLRVPRREPLRQGPEDRRGVRHRATRWRRSSPRRARPTTSADASPPGSASTCARCPRASSGQLEERCRLHLAIGRLAAFPFASFFRYFNHVLAEPGRAALPRPSSTPRRCWCSTCSRSSTCPCQLLRRAAADPEWATGAARVLAARAIGPVGRRRGGRRARWSPSWRGCGRRSPSWSAEAESFEDAIPLLDLIRYFRRDPVVPARLQPAAPVPEEPLHLGAEGPRRRPARAAARHHPRTGHQPQDPGAAEDPEARRAAVLPRESRLRPPGARPADLPARAEPHLHGELPARPVQGPDPGGGHAAREHGARQQPHHAEPHHPAHLDARRPRGAHRAVRPDARARRGRREAAGPVPVHHRHRHPGAEVMARVPRPEGPRGARPDREGGGRPRRGEARSSTRSARARSRTSGRC